MSALPTPTSSEPAQSIRYMAVACVTFTSDCDGVTSTRTSAVVAVVLPIPLRARSARPHGEAQRGANAPAAQSRHTIRTTALHAMAAISTTQLVPQSPPSEDSCGEGGGGEGGGDGGSGGGRGGNGGGTGGGAGGHCDCGGGGEGDGNMPRYHQNSGAGGGGDECAVGGEGSQFGIVRDVIESERPAMDISSVYCGSIPGSHTQHGSPSSSPLLWPSPSWSPRQSVHVQR